MKVLFVHERFGELAGAEVNAQLTAAELKRRGHEVGILHGPGTGRGEDVWRDIFAKHFPFPAQKKAAQVRRVLQEFGPDLVYVHKMADLEVLNALVVSGAPLVRMVHDHDLYCLRSYKYNYFNREICRRPASAYCLFPCAAFLGRNPGGILPVKWNGYLAKKRELHLNRQFQRMIVATQYMKDELVRNGFAAERVEIHAPVPRTDAICLPSSFSDRNRIVYAGQIIRGKGVDVLLESLAQVRVPFECLIYGDGHQRPYCEQLSRRLGLEDRVRFRGWVSQPELWKAYREASVAVLSSVWPEPFGAVGLEAMRYGLPVVAFDAGGIREWLLDGINGFLVPWMDRLQYAARLEQLLLDKDLGRWLGQRGLELVTQQYDFSQYISGLEELFNRVAAESQAPVHA